MKDLQDLVRTAAHPLTGLSSDYDPLLDLIGGARFVLLGEASHGTHEFYRERALITRRLIEEKGFAGVATSGDWPSARHVHRFVTGSNPNVSPRQALDGFERFPAWMWANSEVADFIAWLRTWNAGIADRSRHVGFFGLDLYSLFGSLEVVLQYLDRADRAAARQARERYACFDHFRRESGQYGYAAALGLTPSCEQEVVGQLVDLLRRRHEYAERDGRVAEEEYFDAEQNARLVRNAERYYREMFRGEVRSWNLRDLHMAEILDSLERWLTGRRGESKIVVWAHNSHLGDARATEMTQRGELNLGELVREKYEAQARLVGFTTYTGSVTAASNWGDPPERKKVSPALPQSYEALFHDTGVPRFVLPLVDDMKEPLREPHLERAIGVIYRPETERASHYFYAVLSDQFDAVVHFDETRAVEPLEPGAHWEPGEVAETYPTTV